MNTSTKVMAAAAQTAGSGKTRGLPDAAVPNDLPPNSEATIVASLFSCERERFRSPDDQPVAVEERFRRSAPKP